MSNRPDCGADAACKSPVTVVVTDAAGCEPVSILTCDAHVVQGRKTASRRTLGILYTLPLGATA